MSIKATFSAGVEALTVHGLHQWDYGQKLEITHPDLPAVMEVHFAAVGAQEAVVRVVSGATGVAEVSIPDELLEQSRPILAWVYIVGETSGETMLTVTMPLQARARPTAAGPVPEPIADRYTEAMGAMNAAVESVRGGAVVVAKALAADKATSADSATTATRATTADSATKATKDDEGNTIKSTYCRRALTNTPINLGSIDGEPGGVYLFRMQLDGYIYTALGVVPEGVEANSVLLGTAFRDNETYLIQMDISATNATVYAEGIESGTIWNVTEEMSFSMTASLLFGFPVG